MLCDVRNLYVLNQAEYHKSHMSSFITQVKDQLQKSPYVLFDQYVALASHAECIATIIFIIQLCVVFELWLVKHCKTSLPQKQLQVLDLSVASQKALFYAYYQWKVVEKEVVNANLIAIHSSLNYIYISVMMTSFLIHWFG